MKQCPHCKEKGKITISENDRLSWLICDACDNVFVRAKDPACAPTLQDAVNIILEESDFKTFFAPIEKAIEKALSE